MQLACVATVSFPILGEEIEQANELAGERRSVLALAKNWGEVGRVNEKIEGDGEKSYLLQSILTFY